MSQTVRSKIVKIGNSRGIRIPRVLLEQAGLGDEVDLIVEDATLIVRAAKGRREGWGAAFARMAEHCDDGLLDEPAPTRWDEREWAW